MVLLCVDLFLTRRCNLNCSFCYVKEKDNTAVPEEVQRNLNTCKWLIEEFRSKAPVDLPKEARFIEIDLFGGEPVLAWESIKAIAEWKKTVTDIVIDLILITNMTMIDESKIDYCNENKITIRPTVDGCREVVDMYRTQNGVSVADKIYNNCKLLLSKCKYKWCRSTITPITAKYMLKSIKFLTKELGFLGVMQMLASGVDWTDYGLSIAKEETIKITDWWIQEMRDGNYYYLQNFRDPLESIWHPAKPIRPCMSGLGCGAIDTNGDIYPCHRFCNSDTPEDFRMGNINNGGITNKALTERLSKFSWKKYKKDNCGDCVAINSCRSVCLHDAISSGREIYAPLHRYCEMTKLYHSEVQRAHDILDKEQNELYYKMYKPKHIQEKRGP